MKRKQMYILLSTWLTERTFDTFSTISTVSKEIVWIVKIIYPELSSFSISVKKNGTICNIWLPLFTSLLRNFSPSKSENKFPFRKGHLHTLETALLQTHRLQLSRFNLTLFIIAFSLTKNTMPIPITNEKAQRMATTAMQSQWSWRVFVVCCVHGNATENFRYATCYLKILSKLHSSSDSSAI